MLGPDAVRLLGRPVARTTEGSAFFLTGLQGAGKSVQLLRLKAEDYLNLREPLDLSVSLEKVGDTRTARGDLTAAEDAYTRSRTLRERLADQLGTPKPCATSRTSWTGWPTCGTTSRCGSGRRRSRLESRRWRRAGG